MAIFHSREEYERWIETELPRRYEEMLADPSSALTHEDMLRALKEWDREDGLLLNESGERLKRSA